MRRMDPRLPPAGRQEGQLVGMTERGRGGRKKRVIPDSGYRAAKPTPVMPDIVNRASIYIGFEWIP